MKTKILLCLCVVLAFSSVSFAQSVKVTPRKITYKRPKPLADFKKTFTITYPKISGLTPALNKKVESAISLEKNFDFKLNEEIREIQWLEEASYQVRYNEKGIFSISLSMSGTGAYPSIYEKEIVLDLKTGNRIKPQDIFSNLNGLSALLKKKQQAEIKEAIREIKSDPENDDFDTTSYFENADFKVENLNEFFINDKGVTFVYEYGFPHVARALAPEGRYFLSWAELNPYIRREGLLAQFKR